MIDAEAVAGWREQWHGRVVDLELERSEPWALPLIVRVERDAPPSHGDVLHAAARAVVLLLAHPNSAPDGPWHRPLERWSSGWIRKVVRRARGIRWSEVSAMPGVVGEHRDARVRALLPHPAAEPPVPVAKLQVSGLTLPDDPTQPDGQTQPDGPASDEGAPAVPAGNEPALTIALAPDLPLSTGKAAAQVAHAAQLAALQLDWNTVRAWLEVGVPIRITPAAPDDWRRIADRGAEVAVVHDAGFTEVEPGTATCVATFGPW